MDQTLKVLLVEDQPEAARLVAHTLASVPGTPVELQWAENLAQALRELRHQQYDAVLLDLTLPDSAGFATFLRMREEAPQTPIVILTADEDEAMAISAVRAGAEDYLIKQDLPRDLLPRRIRYAIERRRARMNGRKPEGRVICLMGVKGGCGTTTLTLNLASVLAASEKSTALVELSPVPGGLAAQLGITPEAHLGLLGEISAGGITRRSVEQCLVHLPFGFHGLLALPGSETPQLDPRSTDALLGILVSLYEYVLVDLPAAVTESSLSVMQRASLVLLALERSRVGLRCGKDRAMALRAAGIHEKAIGAVVVNKTTPLIECAPVAEMADQLGCGIVAIIPPAAEELAADSSGVPLAVLQMDLPFSVAIRELGRRLNSDPMSFLNP